MTALPDQSTALEDFYRDVAASELQPLWTQTRDLMTATPAGGAQPWHWSWPTLRELATRSGELIPIERGGERRVLALANPGLDGLPYATPTLWGAVQFLGARESAPAHRHTPGAVRFVLEGQGVWTSVDGDPCPMAPGDLVLTPGWNWHEHHNTGDTAMIWFDGLDLPMVAMLDAVFFEPGESDPAAAPAPERSYSQQLHGHAGLRADDPAPSRPHSPLSVYRWAETDAALRDLAQLRPDATVLGVTFTDPTNGRDVLPTMRCRMERLRPGTRTPSRREVGSSVRVIFSGRGTSVIGGARFDWSAGDMLVVPSWAAVDHEVSETADVFVLSDAPVVEALALDRSEVLAQHQAVTSHPRAT